MKNRLEIRDVIQAYHNIREIIDLLIERKGIKFEISDDAPSTFKGMKEFHENNGYFLVYDGGDHGFLGESYNIKFRALHDAMHLENDLSFSFEHEKQLSMVTQWEFMQIAYRELNKTQWETWCIGQVIQAEIRGQIEYFEANNKYVDDQKAFILDYLQVEEVA